MKAMLMRAGVIAAAVGVVLAGSGPASSARTSRDTLSASDSSAFSAVATVLRGLDSARSTGYSDAVLSDSPVTSLAFFSIELRLQPPDRPATTMPTAITRPKSSAESRLDDVRVTRRMRGIR